MTLITIPEGAVAERAHLKRRYHALAWMLIERCGRPPQRRASDDYFRRLVRHHYPTLLEGELTHVVAEIRSIP